MPANVPVRLVTVPVFDAATVQVAFASFSVPPVVVERFAMPANVPERLVTVPVFDPAIV
jgi:hypothetical protein